MFLFWITHPTTKLGVLSKRDLTYVEHNEHELRHPDLKLYKNHNHIQTVIHIEIMEAWQGQLEQHDMYSILEPKLAKVIELFSSLKMNLSDKKFRLALGNFGLWFRSTKVQKLSANNLFVYFYSAIIKLLLLVWCLLDIVQSSTYRIIE